MISLRRPLGSRLLAAFALAACSPAAFGQCSGFTDVDAAPPFCPAVDWLRNRAITLGCTSSTLFCPQNPVTRLQMAAFMNRLGNALTPTIVYQQGTGTTLNATSATPVCVTGDLAPADYPRAVSFGAVFNMQAGATTGVKLEIASSQDGGSNWDVHALAQEMSGSGTSRWVNGTTWTGNVPLDAGATQPPYKFALLVTPQAGSPSPSAWSCQLKGIVASRTGAAAPH